MTFRVSSLAPSRFVAGFRARPTDGADELIAGPIRGELLGAEHLVERARELARDQRVVSEPRGRRPARLLTRLDETRHILDDAQERLSLAADREVDIGPAGLWLLDNYHVVQEHIYEVRESLPRGYYRELPELARGPLAGYLRVYELAITLISHSEARIDLENVDLFVGAFQEVSALSIGELWAIPAMLRLGLIESVRRMTLRTVQGLDEVEDADRWAARIQEGNENGSAALGEVLKDFVTSPPPLTPIFVSRFLLQLRLAAGAFPPLLWLEQWLAEEGLSAEDAAARSTQRLALTQLMMANSITSLRAIGRRDWRRFVERQSVMERILRSDPSGCYPQMTFATRDRYRHVVERLAKRSDSDEATVANQAIDLARVAMQGASQNGVEQSTDRDCRSHVGYYLMDHGRPELEQLVRFRPSARETVHRWVLRHPNVLFVGGLVVGTALALAMLLWLAGPSARVAWLTIVLLAVVPASEIALNLVNQLVTAFLPPSALSKLDLSEEGVPAKYRTAVVIPTLFGSVAAVEEALENLEVQYLANREAHLHFAVLSDFTDAPTEVTDADASIVAAAVAGVEALNARYAGGAQSAFYLFHRPRRWNAREGVWMGWERKRGKLAEFNRFLRGSSEEAFSVIVGEVEPLRAVRFVITLDADTVLPPDAAPALVGAMAHPLNRAVYDEKQGRVVRGYGIMQPRVGVSLPSAHQSLFARIHSGHPGVDPYTTAVSDVYQDLYGEGSFTGKGIYDVDAFEEATYGRFPENTLLSHDLIEGSYVRAGLATDITVYDDYPTRYLTYTRRKHRWIRGDWQLLWWLLPNVPGRDGREPNRLSVLSRWKILDNMRRSTVEITQLLFLLAGWTILPGSPLKWTILALTAIGAPWIIALILAVLRPPLDKSWRAYYAAVGQDAITSVEQVWLAIAFLPHQAWVSADAILRTWYRLFISRRHLLEWQTASQTERVVASSSREVWKTMWPGVTVAVVMLGFVLAAEFARVRSGGAGVLPFDVIHLWHLGIATLPLTAIWVLAPAIAHALSKPAVRRERRLPPDARALAMRYALLHWHFFDHFVSAATHWLAPDNFQEDPTPEVAMRTSPTNIGLQLLSTVSAYDLGFISLDDMTHRLELAMRSLERMRRFRGHLFNWYDLHELRVLEPAYISTVDSGNFAGHLIALRQACLSLPDEPVFDARVWRALDAGLALAHERLRALGWRTDSAPASVKAFAEVDERLKAARAALGPLSRATTRGSGSNTSGVAPANDHREALARMAGLVSAAQDSCARRLTGVDESASVCEWVDWCARLIGEHRERLESFAVASSPDANVASSGAGRAVATQSIRECAEHSTRASELIARLEAIANRAYDYAMEMDFRFLFDDSRKLFSIGYQRDLHALDASYYDLLASEARLTSFIAIAKNDVPLDHWFRLGRTLTNSDGERALVSWSGSMFEYLMPPLVMRSYPFTLLDATYQGAVRRQISYAEERGVPWGISESAYNVRDRHLTYQYRAFGVPDLALKRGLGRDLVVAPYAAALAMMIEPQRSLANLRTLEGKGALGAYGFCDALDYTRPNPGARYAVVRSYMAHHIGMSFVAMSNVLLAHVWPRRFHADPIVRSAELLLHERVPRRLVTRETQDADPEDALPDAEVERSAVREFDTPDTAQPHVALLGYLPYAIMVSHEGAGYSRYDDRAVTRWRADGTLDNTGQFCYVKDIGRGRTWSAAHQPTCANADWYRALLATDRVTFHREDGDIETRTEIVVIPADAAEVRRVTVTNNGDEARDVELTSYGEIVLAPRDADRAHPAFSNLFVETEFHEWCSAIMATRRPRSAHEPSLWCVHVVDDPRLRVGAVTCETDRARFLGRGRTTREPIAMERDGPMSGTTGAVLDPIFALRTRVRLLPGQSSSVAFTTLVTNSRERAFELADRYHGTHAWQRALDLAWTSSQIELRELNISPSDAAIFQEMAGHLLYSYPALRASHADQLRNAGSQQRLWAMGVSGDWPILLATIEAPEGLPTLRHLFAAHRYWRRRGVMVDLVILNTHANTYLQELQNRIVETMYSSSDSGSIDRPGGVFSLRGDLLGAEDRLMLAATARLHIACDGRSLGRILEASKLSEDAEVEETDPWTPGLRIAERSTPRSATIVQRFRARASRVVSPLIDLASPSRAARARLSAPSVTGDDSHLMFHNGLGGLTSAGEYEIRVRGDEGPPAPWANVVANPRAGFIASERGVGCTWVENSYFFRLTPWHNDPVSDPVSDALYLRDEETGAIWSATPAPVRSEEPYVVRHGPGRTAYAHQRDGIESRLTLGVAEHDPVRIAVLRLKNHDSRERRIGITAYAEWTLGSLRERTQHQVHTEFVPTHEAIVATNDFEPQFAGWVAFMAMSEPISSFTADRREFLGRNGTMRDPAALHNERLSGTHGAGFDPCAALQCAVSLAPGQACEIVVILGAAEGREAALHLIRDYRGVATAHDAVDRSVESWKARLSVVAVRTPEPSFDHMINTWTLYQALASRMWARTATYQSSGAFGFRDQLQDVMAFVYAEPALARAHILRASARQFAEGDVQHWWHPQSGRGVRTRFSDDLAWLPYVVDHYIRVTGDATVLDEYVPFIAMRALEPHEHEVYDLPTVTDEHASVYEHCLRALRRASTVGDHGLPLIGIGDWNDGMNRVGVGGKGESVWLAWFLITTLRAFAKHADARGDASMASEFRGNADGYLAAVESAGWDGEWYRRAYFDDGTPLGSASSDECQIDSIAQSWSVISRAGDPERQTRAMRSLEDHLVRDDARLLMLLTPPFDKTPNDPGYIKGYLPGVRENGAQYTHAALWAVLATAMRGDGDRAFELYQMINPLMHAVTPDDVATYKVEPYVVAADVYTAHGQLGRGGWTWYTGSASWMYRVGVESILGFTKVGDTLVIAPCVPTTWPEYTIEYRFGSSMYVIVVRQPGAIQRAGAMVTLDGKWLEGVVIPLRDDGSRHKVEVQPRTASE